MHELGIACSILETVREEASKRPESRFLKVGVRIGEVSGVEPEALIFSFDALVEGSELAPLELVIERTQRRHLCPECQHEFVVVNYARDASVDLKWKLPTSRWKTARQALAEMSTRVSEWQ
jgi:hydrogenase nickel incorporation protein HypA/HybF